MLTLEQRNKVIGIRVSTCWLYSAIENFLGKELIVHKDNHS